MIPEKYANLGFELTNFGKNSKVLRFAQKPVFVFNSKADIDVKFLTHICETYLKVSDRRKKMASITS